MNSGRFYKEIQTYIATLKKEQLEKFVNNIIRKIPESEYEEILYMTYNRKIEINEQEIKQKVKKYKEKFKDIDEGKIYFYERQYEDYDSYGWDNWKIEYTDKNNIGKIIKEVAKYAVELVNSKQYSYAKELIDLIIETNYQAFDEDIEEIEEISLLDIQAYNLTTIKIQEICQYAIYSTYQVSNNKVEDIYYYFKNNPNFIHISIEEAFKLGIEQLENLDDFFEEWIQYLSKVNGNKEYRLLKEALEYTGYKRYEKHIKQITQNQPKILIDIFDYLKKENKISELINLGNEALETIDKNQEIGSDIALYLANMDTSNQEKYIYKAFMFKVSILNLLRIINNGYYNKYEKDIKNMIKINNSEEKYYLKFFIGDFEDFYEESVKHKELLGWTGSFEKMSVYMWLLLLNQMDSPTKSYFKLLTSVFQEIDYNEDKNEFLENDIRKIWITWKNKFKLKTETKEKAMKWLNKVIENRVEAIMEGNYRKSYYKAALIVVGYGEILEIKNKGAKDEYINYYKKKYSRRSAFKYELDELK